MKHLLSLFVAALVAINIFASTTYDFAASIPAPWTSSPAPTGYEATDRGAQFTANTTVKLAGCTNVTSVSIIASSNINSGYKLKVKVGGTLLNTGDSTELVMQIASNQTYPFTASTALNGDIEIIITKAGSKKSIYIKSVTVEGDVPAVPNPADRLDPTYVYPADPITILPQDSLGKIGFDTIIGNILFECTNAAYYKTDLRVLAGGVLTITASKPLKAVVVDGLIKKGFTATATADSITYLNAEDDDVSGTPVLAILDIDSSAVTITCNKQIQMQAIYIYFDENPDVEIGDDDYVPIIVASAASATGSFPFNYCEFDFGSWTYDQSVYMTFWSFDYDDQGYAIGDGAEMYFSFFPSSSADISGTYTIDDYSIDDMYSAITVVNGTDTVSDYFYTATVVVTKESDGSYTVQYSVNTYEGNVDYSGVISGLYYEDQAPVISALEDAAFRPLDLRAPMFNVSGQRVGSSYRGLIIQNGKKYILLP